MKKWILSCCVLVSVGAFAQIGNIRPHGPRAEVMTYADVNEALFTEITNGKQPDKVIQFAQGDKITFEIDFTGPLFSLACNKEGTHELTVMQTFFMRNAGKGFEFSGDMKNWKSFGQYFVGMLHSHLDLKGHQAVTKLQFEVYPNK